jgi:cellulose synthase/poly-beta-1,6-N-acetylglucosamine synthase-like glycosyltransferase
MSDTESSATPPADVEALPPAVCREIFVVIPAYNEGARVAEVIRDVRAHYPNVVVVDDGSRDDSGARSLAAGAVVLTHVVNRGQGAALTDRHRLRPGPRRGLRRDLRQRRTASRVRHSRLDQSDS